MSVVFYLDEKSPPGRFTSGLIALRGWCLDEEHRPVEDLHTRVDGVPWRVSRRARKDLVDAFDGETAAEWGGFLFEYWLEAGSHRIEVFAGGKCVWARTVFSYGIVRDPWRRFWQLKGLHSTPGESGKLPAIDVVGVFYDRPDSASEWFSSLAEAAEDLPGLKVFVQEHGAIPVVADLVEEWSSRLRIDWVHNPENPGFGAGCNAAARRGDSPFLFFLNPDATLPEGTLVALLKQALATRAEGFVGWEAAQTPWEHPKIYHPLTGEVEWSSAAAWLVDREAFEKTGGFEESIFLYGEDVELSWRLRADGGRLQYASAIPVVHHSYSAENLHSGKPLQIREGSRSNAFMRGRFAGVRGWFGASEEVRSHRQDFLRGLRTASRKFRQMVPRFHGLQHEVARLGCENVEEEVLPDSLPEVRVRLRKSEIGFPAEVVAAQMNSMRGIRVHWNWLDAEEEPVEGEWVFDMEDSWMLFPDALAQMVAKAKNGSVRGLGMVVEGKIEPGRWNLKHFSDDIPVDDDPNRPFRPGVLRRGPGESHLLAKTFWLEAEPVRG
ncbi:glycosyltransferase [Puniceicoccus vermicola]|uniref:Glycosyltransferase n=1 Tax=Puniceicoccus vermicola TaxID=388746 RepID=A0A7X1E348_9BACT|nr:glycosyltransferase [Puniceicoccus vermicola]MBC2601115.1 glycosyltransferase [Puniceicoccus vermicola]